MGNPGAREFYRPSVVHNLLWNTHWWLELLDVTPFLGQAKSYLTAQLGPHWSFGQFRVYHLTFHTFWRVFPLVQNSSQT